MRFHSNEKKLKKFIKIVERQNSLEKSDSFSIFYPLTDQEVNRKRGRREHRNSNRYANPNQIPNTSRRGDISVIHGDCDGS